MKPFVVEDTRNSCILLKKNTSLTQKTISILKRFNSLHFQSMSLDALLAPAQNTNAIV